ncbi:hypothetical protein BPS10C_041 [Bacillus phage BPS10C]|uniref:Uncharacterized protein n=1 Tax=Bacillus phage BPS10C TaxID=1277886 RepID=W5QUH6_9CAUD|nr:hypothetical protein BPS10C_041 [Bacillus phage BPS10C]AGI12038.1 hypothetical protein BPS10C_041 [Bacillus phage BPS10C]
MSRQFNFVSDSENIFATAHLTMSNKGKIKVTIRKYATEEKTGPNRKQTIKMDAAESHRLLDNLERKYNEYANGSPDYQKELFTQSAYDGVSTWLLSDKSLFGIATCNPVEIHNVAFFRLRKYRKFIDALKILVKAQEEILRDTSL